MIGRVVPLVLNMKTQENRSEKFQVFLRAQQTSHAWYDIPCVEDLGENGALTLEEVN